MPSGLKNKMVNQAHHHHHQGQKKNRPHQRTITHPQGPLEPPQLNDHIFGRSEGLIGPPLPRLDREHIPVVEHLLYIW